MNIAELSGVSPDCLPQIFKHETGDNLSSYVLTKKLEYAKKLILKGMRDREISETLNPPPVSLRLFKNKYRITPTEYKSLLK